MGTAIRYGILLGVLVEIWTAVIIVTGWYRDPSLQLLFFLVIPLEIVLVVLALRATASDADYGRQVTNGAVLSAVAGVIIVFGSILVTTVVFPHYYADLKAIAIDAMTRGGRSPEEIDAQMKASAAMYDPWSNGISGFVGTVATGILTALVAGIFLRRKPAA
jgi:hypothetical protein